MRLLLDTHSALWMFAGSPEISPELELDLTDPENDLYFSEVSAWEIVIKHALGKLKLPASPEIFLPEMVTQHCLARHPISLDAIFEWGKLPMIHRDPFDRLLVAQAIRERFTLVSCDPEIQKYTVPIHWR
jgi:PIN domain nuclease of toxin-antitoxin system